MRLLLPLLLLAQRVIADSYTYDWYFWACYYSAVTNLQFAAECPLPADPEDYITPWKCHCRSDNTLRTMYTCIETFAEKAGKPQAIKDSWRTVTVNCPTYYETQPLYNLKQVQEAVRTNPVTQTFEEANSTLTGAFLQPPEYFSPANIEAGIDSHFQSWAPQAYGRALVGYVFGIMLLQTIMNFMGWFLPTANRLVSNSVVGRAYRQHFALPALIHKKRAEPLKFTRAFYVQFPPRLHSFLLAGYLLLSIVFICVRYDYVADSTLNSTKAMYFGDQIGYRAGCIAMFNVPLLWLFAARNNFLIWLTGWQYEVFAHWHRWLARIFTLEIIVHAAAWSVYMRAVPTVPGEQSTWSEEWGEAYWRWGVVALIGMCVMCFQAMRALRQLAYDFFLLIHILVAIPVVIGMWYHLAYVTTCQEELYAAIAIWAFDRAARIGRIIVANPFTSKAEITAHEGGVIELTIKYSKWWKPAAGSYVFVHFLDPLRFLQAHPFTIMESCVPEEAGQLKFYAKARGGMTKHIYNKALAKGAPMTTRVWLEGPYGVAFNIQPFRETVLVAGGIGITAVYSHLVHLAKSVQDHTFYVHWVIGDERPLDWFGKEIALMRSLPNVQVTINVAGTRQPGSLDGSSTGEETKKAPSLTTKSVDGSDSDALSAGGVVYNRPDLVAVVQDHIANSQGPICTFVCGPASMSDDVRYACSRGVSLTKNFVQFYEESFTM